LNDSLKLRKHLAQMGLENVEAIAAVAHIDMIAHGHSDLSAAWHYRFV
jgi:2-keto-3-deoxy-L-rhamnonate aldolase RhmA